MSVNYIIVADDKVPNDPISVMALNIAKPVDCELSIIPFFTVKIDWLKRSKAKTL